MSTEQPWQEVADASGETLGWMQAPDPVTGKYPEDTRAVVLETQDGDPVAMANLDVDYFGEIDDGMVPEELWDLGLIAKWVDW